MKHTIFNLTKINSLSVIKILILIILVLKNGFKRYTILNLPFIAFGPFL